MLGLSVVMGLARLGAFFTSAIPTNGEEMLDPCSGMTAKATLGVGRIDLSRFAPPSDKSLRYIIEHSTGHDRLHRG